ncbi:flagellar protein export ATPase FliI [Methylocystis parvus]|uniref:Flagellar protein export ATPase FliI n=1 Tax=Methylocystis parvus TaxID=134 RepID=A0A6B8MA03_9HYPH|nr:flagellar protein export ATPase FliI [Methylocystis parvus]
MNRLSEAVASVALPGERLRISGTVTEVFPSHFHVAGLSPFLRLDDCVLLEQAGRAFHGQAIRIDRKGALVKSFESNAGLGLGARVTLQGPIQIAPHSSWKGRVVDALARPIDEGGPLTQGERRGLNASPPSPMARMRLSAPAPTGVAAIDAFAPLCLGQRIGVFAGSGVGKSTLLAMIARSRIFDAAVICLVGERGREVRDFLDEALGASASNAVIVVSTSDESPMMRRLAPLTAMSIGESFRDQGQSVLLIMDSVTRYAHALREIALSAGEPPAANGYAPSVFADLPRLLERAGPGSEGAGSMTAIFSVLIDGDNHNDPVADCIRGTLDGHIVLERSIAEQGRYPAIDILKSISRVADRVWRPQEREMISKARGLVAKFEDTRDLRLLGGYRSGADPELDRAIGVTPLIYDLLRQASDAPPASDIVARLDAMLRQFTE